MRSSKAATELMKKAQSYAASKNMPLLVAVVSGEDVLRKDKLYEHLGFRYLGGVYARGF